jgi:hypothetical protein
VRTVVISPARIASANSARIIMPRIGRSFIPSPFV